MTMGLILFILVSLIMLILSGYVLSWAWNTFVVPTFNKPSITTMQGVALFVLFYFILGMWRF